ncbi:MAG: hypothetical protein IPN32_38480 [Deltaproteobacteria bacterium]|nr:hypothetical protein [Deltaproteobacteria bacterium]MBK8720555.1 hypothetical protein [Deltaproteobacteria bacterium]
MTPDEMLQAARTDQVHELLMAVRLHCVWLRKLEARLVEAGLDAEATTTRDGRRVLTSHADACLEVTERIDVEELDR